MSKECGCLCPCLEALLEGKMKSSELMVLAAEISRQSSTDCALWLLVTILRQIYNEEEQVQQGKTYSLMRKGAPGNAMLQQNPMLKEIQS